MRDLKKTLLALFVLAALLSNAAVLASHTGAPFTIGDFEIDGNTTDEALAGIDWDTFPEAVTFNDPEDPACLPEDDIFSGGGSKEFTPGTWLFDCGSVPQKDDILGGAIGQRDVAGEAWLIFRFTRKANTGDAVGNTEFNQSDQTFDNDGNPSTPEIPVRTAGDLLLVLEVTNGGQTTTLDVLVWEGTSTAGIWKAPTLAPVPVQGTDWDAATNFDNKGRWTFAEAAVRLANFGIEKACPGFGRAWIKSISSHNLDTAVLKDRTVRKEVNLSNCATKNWTFSFTPQPIAGVAVFAVYTVQGGETRTLQLTDGDGDGTFTAGDDKIPPGTVTFRFEVRNRSALIWQSPQGSESFATGETKTNAGSLAYSITLAPQSAENFADTPHVLTARVFEVGTNAPLPNVPVNFGTLGGTPDGCGSLSPTSGVTDANGEVTTTLTSADPCTTSIRAWVNGSAAGATSGFDSGEANATASKVFVRYALTVTPPSAVNEANQPHTFTIRLTKDSGSGPIGVAGASVHLSLNTGGTDAHFTDINGNPASGTEADCTTDADGSCTATVVSSQSGEVSLTATYTATAGGQTRQIDNTGTKRYVDASISITPGAAVNAVGAAHTFTITVTAHPDGASPVVFGAITATVSPAPDSQSSTCDTPTIDGNAATCTLTITNSSAGAFSANATGGVTMGGVTVIRSTSGNSGPGGSGPAVKRFVDASISITPDRAVNEVGVPHVFTVTVTAFPSGVGTPAYSIGTSVSPAPDSQDSTCDAPTISADGNTATCTVTINSATPVTFTVNATADVTMGGVTVTRSTSGNSGPGGSDPATKVYVQASIEKLACPTDTSPRGGLLEYTISLSVAGAPLHDATVSDDLPGGVIFLSASDIAGVSPTTPAAGSANGAVTWSFSTLAEGSYTATISVRVAEDAALEQPVHNQVTFDADEITPKTAAHDVRVTNEGKDAGGRAYGVRVDVLGGGLVLGDPDVPPTPDSDVTNPGELASVPNPLPGATEPLVTLLRVAETDLSGSNSAGYSAIATADDVNVNVPGVVQVEADDVIAMSTSLASISGAGSSRGGSLVKNLRVNGTQHGNVSEPTTILVKDPVSGAVLAEVRVLEAIPGGAAAGETQPNADLTFESDLTVNGIHVIVYDVAATTLVNEASDTIVSHAETAARFASGLGCDAAIPSVSGSAFALGVANVTPDPGSVRVAQVNLPITGGSDSATLADVDLPASLGTSDSVFTSTSGEITDLDGDGTAVEAHSVAQVEGLSLASLTGGTIAATKVKATSDSTLAGSTGDTIIAELIVAGFDVCAELGLNPTCEPDPNTVLLLPGTATIVMLNEQIPEPGGLTVNAVHIWVLGAGNPFGLPAGAEFIISSAHSDAHPAPVP